MRRFGKLHLSGLALLALMLGLHGGRATADVFGTGANQFTVDFVSISGASNPTSGYGIVNNSYRMGKFEVTNDQWTKFKSAYGTPAGDPWYAYDAPVFFTGANVPVNNISWYQAAQFVNWLNTSKGYQPAYKFTGTQGASDYALTTWSPTEAAGANLYRNKSAFYFLPTEDEWVKAAYWNSATSTLQSYATVGNVAPAQGTGTGATGWNFYNNGYATATPGPWNVGSGSQELNGTYDMMGNAWEWTESPYGDPVYAANSPRALRGGSFNFDASGMVSSTRGNDVSSALTGDPASGYDYDLGFRIASVMTNAINWTGAVNNVWDVNTTANFTGTTGKFNAFDYVTFDDTGANTTISIASGGVTPGNVVFNNNAKPYTISGGPIQGAGSLVVSGGGVVTLNSPNTYTGGTTVISGTLNLGNQDAIADNTPFTISGGTLNLGGFTKTTNAVVSFQSGATQNGVLVKSGAAYDAQSGAVSAALQGTAGLAKTTTGTFILSGNNAYTGATSVTQGLLRLGSANALPGGIGAAGGLSALTLNGGVVELAADDFQRTLGASSAQFQITGGTSGFSAYGAPRAITVGNDPATELQWGSAAFAPATLVLNETTANNALTLANKLDLNGATRTIAVNANVATISGAIRTATGTAGISKNGAGTLVLSGANTYSGTTAVGAGILKAGVASVANVSGAFGKNSAVTLTNAAGVALDITGYNTQIGSLAGGGGNGGNVTLGAATLTVGGDNTSTTYSGVISSSAGVSGVSLYKTGSGQLQLDRANTYTGKTVIDGANSRIYATENNGTLADAKLGAPPSTFQADNITLKNGGILNLASGADGRSLSANRGIYLDGAGYNQINTGYGDFYVYGAISGPGALWHNILGGYCRLYLGSDNTYYGDTGWNASGSTGNYGGIDMNGHALALQNSALDANSVGSWLGVAATSGVLRLGGLVNGNRSLQDLTGNATLTGLVLNVYDSAAVKTYTNVIGTGNQVGTSVTKTGPGTQALNGVNTYTGTTTISAGILSANSIVVSGGGSSLGNAASAVILGDATNQGTLSYTGAAATYSRGFTVNAGGGALLNAGTGLLTVSTGGITAGGLFTVGGTTQNIGISGIISGSGGLTKTGANTLTLSGANTYAGATTINGGRLRVTNTSGSATGTGAVQVSGGTSLGGTGRISGAVAVAGGTTASTQGAIDLLDGAIGTLNLGSTLSLGGASGSYSLLNIEYNSLFDRVTTGGALTVGAGGVRVNLTTLGVPSDGTYTILSAASGITTGAFTFDGTSSVLTKDGKTFTLGGDATALRITVAPVPTNPMQTFVCNTPLAAISARPGAAISLNSTLSNTGAGNLAVTLTSTANVALGSAPSTVANGAPATITGTIAAGSAAGPQAWQVTNTDASAAPQTATIAGAINVYALANPGFAATLDLGYIHVGDSVDARNISFTNAAANAAYQDSLDVAATKTNDRLYAPTSINNLAPNAGSIMQVGVNASAVGSLADTLTLTMTSKAMTISGLADVVLTNTTPASITTTGYVYSGQGVWGATSAGNWNDFTKWTAAGGAPGLAASFRNGEDSATFNGAGAVVDLNGASPVVGSLAFGGSGNYQITGSGTLTLAGAATIGVDAGRTAAIGAKVSGLTVTKTGAGALLLTGANDYTGLTTVKAGTMELGTPAQSRVLAGAGVDIQQGKLIFDAANANTIQTLLTASYNAPAGKWQGEQFKSTTAPITGLTLGWKQDTETGNVTVMATYAGDANLDGSVDGIDLDVWKANVGSSTANFAMADLNYDGSVDGLDLDLWKATVGSSGAGTSTAIAPVPEPGTLALLIAGLLGLLAWRRRSQKSEF